MGRSAGEAEADGQIALLPAVEAFLVAGPGVSAVRISVCPPAVPDMQSARPSTVATVLLARLSLRVLITGQMGLRHVLEVTGASTHNHSSVHLVGHLEREAAPNVAHPASVKPPRFVLVLSGALEAVWAIALGKSEGFTRLQPTLVFLVAIVLSMGGLADALRTLPIGTGYAVWVGVGASLTVVYGMVSGAESVSLIKVLLLMGLIGCIIGLKLAH